MGLWYTCCHLVGCYFGGGFFPYKGELKITICRNYMFHSSTFFFGNLLFHHLTFNYGSFTITNMSIVFWFIVKEGIEHSLYLGTSLVHHAYYKPVI